MRTAIIMRCASVVETRCDRHARQPGMNELRWNTHALLVKHARSRVVYFVRFGLPDAKQPSDLMTFPWASPSSLTVQARLILHAASDDVYHELTYRMLVAQHRTTSKRFSSRRYLPTGNVGSPIEFRVVQLTSACRTMVPGLLLYPATS